MGNRSVGERDLIRAAEQELARLQTSELKAAAADDAAFRMAQEYRNRGYAFAQVAYRLSGEDPLRAVFRVEEGPQVTVRRIILRGNTAFQNEQLQAYFTGPRQGLLATGRLIFVAAAANSAVEQIRELYLGEGYADVSVDPPAFDFSPDRASVDIRVTLREGRRYVIREVRFRGDILRPARPQLSRLYDELAGRPYYKRREINLQTGIQEAYADLGYPDARAPVERLTGDDPGAVILQAQITSGVRVRIARVRIEGNRHTRTSFIENRLLLHAGDYYNLSKERESFRRLYGTGLFTQVDLGLEQDGEEMERTLAVKVEEVQPRAVAVEAGWGSYEQLRGRAEFLEKSLFGLGQQARVRVGASFKGENAAVSLIDPWVLESDTSAEYSGFYRRYIEPSFTLREYGASALYSRQLMPGLTLTLGYVYRRTYNFDIATGVDVSELPTQYNVGDITLKGNYDTRNDLFFPMRGQRSYLTAEASKPALGGTLDFYRFTAETRWFFSLWNSNTILAARYGTGVIIPAADEFLLPLSERFYNGGDTTVRSFTNYKLGPLDPAGNAVGGLAFNVINLEVRQRLYENIFCAVFFDWGNISPNGAGNQLDVSAFVGRGDLLAAAWNDYFSDFRAAIGGGIQYLTPVGPARLDVGFNPSPRADRREPTYVVQFAVGWAY